MKELVPVWVVHRLDHAELLAGGGQPRGQAVHQPRRHLQLFVVCTQLAQLVLSQFVGQNGVEMVESLLVLQPFVFQNR